MARFAGAFPLSSLRTWFRPRLGQSSGFPTLLFVVVAALLSYTAVRGIDLGTFEVPIYFINERGWSEGAVQPTYRLNLHTDRPTWHQAGSFDLRSGDILLINTNVPRNIVAWPDAGIGMFIAIGYHSCIQHHYSFLELALSGWTARINSTAFEPC